MVEVIKIRIDPTIAIELKLTSENELSFAQIQNVSKLIRQYKSTEDSIKSVTREITQTKNNPNRDKLIAELKAIGNAKAGMSMYTELGQKYGYTPVSVQTMLYKVRAGKLG